MKLKELIFQNAGSEKEPVKVKFSEFYNLIETSKQGVTPAEFNAVMRFLFFPGSEMPSQNHGFGEPANSLMRIGATFTHGGDTYRFVRDVNKRAYSLSKFDPQKRDFTEVSKDRKFIRRAFEETFRVPKERVYDKLYSIDPGYLIGNGEPEESLNLGDSSAYFGKLADDSTIEEKYEKLTGLLEESRILEKMRSLEFEIDGMQTKLFEITDKLSKIRDREEEVKNVARELDEYKTIEAVGDYPQDIDRKLKEYAKAKDKKEAEMLALDGKSEALLEVIGKLDLKPPKQDSIFVAGAAFGLISFALMIFLSDLRFIFFGSLAISMGLVAWRLINYFRKRDREEGIKSELKALKEERAVIEKKFDIETSVVRKFIERIGESDADDALESIKKVEDLKSRLREENNSLQSLKSEFKASEIEAKKAELEGKIKSLEAELRNLPSVSVDPNEIKNEIDRLKEEIGEENLERFAKEHSGSETPRNVYEQIVAWASQLLKMPAQTVIEALKSSYEVNLKILSGGRYDGVSWGQMGPKGISSGKDKHFELSELKDMDGFIAYFAFQFTTLKLLSKICPMPVTVFGTTEKSYPGYDKKLFLQAVNNLSRVFQIVHIA